MQIVIDIDEARFKDIQRIAEVQLESNHFRTAEQIIAKGLPLEQESCELLIIKSDLLLRQDDRNKWMESIKREKESGVIILPPYFEPLLVPNDIEISIEQEPQGGEE